MINYQPAAFATEMENNSEVSGILLYEPEKDYIKDVDFTNFVDTFITKISSTIPQHLRALIFNPSFIETKHLLNLSHTKENVLLIYKKQRLTTTVLLDDLYETYLIEMKKASDDE